MKKFSIQKIFNAVSLETLKKPLQAFHQVLLEGNYNSKHSSLWTRMFNWKPEGELPDTTVRSAGTAMLGTMSKIANRMLWLSLFTMMSTRTLMHAGIALATTGLGMYGLEFVRAVRTRRDFITEVNFAGQRVEGTRRDLCRLHQAQDQIMHLASVFKQASTESTSDTVKRILDSVQEERSRVSIVNPGPYGAKTDIYDFSEPAIKLVEDGDMQPKPPLPPLSLRQAFSENELAARIAVLEEALPPGALARARARVNKRKQAP